MRSEFKLTKPCATCPFRTDIPPFLTKGRVDEIDAALVRGTFPCHKTVDYAKRSDDEENEGMHSNAGESHCAGALILLEKLNRPSQMMRIAERLGMYDRTKLDMAAPVFGSFRAMRAAMPARRRRSS